MYNFENNYFSYGIVQGRLTVSKELQRFPQENWQQEFIAAKNLKLNFIEWLTEREYNESNPIWSDSGRKLIKEISATHNLQIYSVCSNYVINHSLFKDEDKSVFKHVKSLCEASHKIDCKVLVLPLLEKSNLTKETSELLKKPLFEIANIANDLDMVVSIESLMKSDELKVFLEDLNCSNIKVVFDTGNRALISDNLNNEIISLKNYINHIHIKDKDIYENNVLLGTGMVNFKDIFITLQSINYKGPIVFETNRGNDPIRTAKHNIDICNFFYYNALNA